MTDSFFQAYSVNGLEGDPAVYLFVKTSGDAVLFDLGLLDSLTQRDLLKVRHAFVSHTHMDHFMGFDRWLRVNIPHRRLLKVWGPAPFFSKVQAKLRSYMWNLIDPDQVRFQVYEIQKDGAVHSALLSNSDDFEIHKDNELGSLEKLLELPDGSVVSGAILDHRGIPSISYKFRAPDKLRVIPEQVAKHGLTPGPWIGEMQLAIRQGQMDKTISIGDRDFRVEELDRMLLQKEAGTSLVYCTDAGFTAGNVAALKKAFGSATDMICESSFLDADRSRAVAKAHLTSRQASLLAAVLSVRDFTVFHISGFYGTEQQRVADEAKDFFAQNHALSPSELEKAVDDELQINAGNLCS